MSELQKTQQKMCGNCLYGDYYRRRTNRELRTWVDCEVYSTKKAAKEKACGNWKERKINVLHT